MYYKLIYQTKGSSEKLKHSFKDKKEMLAFIHQLHRGIATIQGSIYKGIESFSYFELRQRNYIQKTDTEGEYIVGFGKDGHPIFKGGFGGEIFTPVDEDITNVVLDDCKMTSEEKNMHFDGEYLWIYGKDFQFKGKTNIRSLIELIFKTQKRLNINSFGYYKILETGQILNIQHQLPKVLDYDFCWRTIKNRFSSIQKELNLEKEFIKFSTQGVEINI